MKHEAHSSATRLRIVAVGETPGVVYTKYAEEIVDAYARLHIGG